MLCNLVFANDTILLCFFFLFLIIGLHFLIPSVIAQIFNCTAEFAIPTGKPYNEGLTAETKARKCF